MFRYFSTLQGRISVLLALTGLIFLGVAGLELRLRNASSNNIGRLMSLERSSFEANQKFFKAVAAVSVLPFELSHTAAVGDDFASEGAQTAPVQAVSELPQGVITGIEEAAQEIRVFAENGRHQGLLGLVAALERVASLTSNPALYREARLDLQKILAKEALELGAVQREKQTQFDGMGRAGKERFEKDFGALLSVLLIGFAVIAASGMLLSRSTAGRLMDLVEEQKKFVKLVQEGKADLSSIRYVEGDDEVSQLRNAFSALKEAYGNLIFSIRDTGKRLEDMIQDDLRYFGELAAATEQMGSTARSIALTASGISESASGTADASKSGRCLLQSTASELKEAAERVREGVERMESLANKVREVDQVVQIIRTIASQTNLLALNAAIEASRAGDAGKGFAVVAEEVRKLALQTSKSAENVIGLVQGIQDETQEAVKLIQVIETESTAAASGAHSSQETFEKISERSSELATQIHGIASATDEQRATVESMGRRISELFQNVEHSLKPQLNTLVKTVEGFKVERSSS